MFWQIKTILHCHFPDLKKRLNGLPDSRTGVEYSIEELVMAAIVLFLLKCESRNEFNHKSRDGQFRENYIKMFRLRPPHMDAVNSLFEKISTEEFKQLRCHLVSGLIEKRVFHKLRFFKDCVFCVAVDGTGFYNWGSSPPETIRQYALKKESKKEAKKKPEKESEQESGEESGGGKANYSSQVLEAVLVCNNRITIPLISEWIANDGQQYDKQDCELKAFKRLADRLNKYFPRMRICILADGLYSNVAMMNVCRQHGWNFITVFKDGNLPSVWEEVNSLLPLAGAAETRQKTFRDSINWIISNYRWINGIDYQKHKINWVECVVETERLDGTGEKNSHRFVFLTTRKVDWLNVEHIVTAGRARWSIEDHFNTQKNRGGALHHKFNRNTFNALKNWHNIRQLACIINELVEYTQVLQRLLKENAKMTLKELWKNLNAFLTMCSIDSIIADFEHWAKMPRQVRLE